MNLIDALNQYKAKFGDSPHILWMDTNEAIALIQKAIETGVPIPNPEVPEGAVI
jgi:hypothetical protein